MSEVVWGTFLFNMVVKSDYNKYYRLTESSNLMSLTNKVFHTSEFSDHSVVQQILKYLNQPVAKDQ